MASDAKNASSQNLVHNLDSCNLPNHPRLLLASIHDVGPRFADEVDRLYDLLTPLLGGPKLAMLVVADHWGEAPLSSAPAFQRKLRDWADSGVEMFVHGWFHRDLATHHGLDRIRASAMTAREGEFLGLDQAAAAQRMRDGRALLEDIIGQPAAGFIAPAWLYGDGARAALRESDFALAEDHFRVWQPQSGRIVARGPVITWASRSAPRRASSLAVAAMARHGLHQLSTVRLAVHPGDTGHASLLDSITRTVSAFATRRVAGHYRDLLL